MSPQSLPCPVMSEGRLYNIDIPGNLFHIRPMCGDTEEIIAGLEDQQGTALGDIAFRHSTASLIDLPKDLPFHNLLVSDWVTCMMYIMSATYGSIISFKEKCTSCNAPHFPIAIDLGTLESKTASDFEDKYEEPFQYELPMSKTKVGFRLLRLADLDGIQQYAEQAKKKVQVTKRNPTTTYILSHQVVAVNGENLAEPALHRWIRETVRGDLDALRRAIEEKETGFSLRPEIVCPNCGYSFRKRLPINFFRAFGAPAE